MSKQPPPAPIASAIGPCPTIIQVSRTPRHWKFTQHLRTTRPPLRGWMTCLRFYVLYIISVSPGRRKGDNGKQCAMKSRLQLKRFPSSASVGNRARDSLIIKPALNPHSAAGRIELVSFADIIRKLTSSNLLFLRIV